MENMSIYNAYRSVPKEALKPITAGRLKGKSDINPMWRIKALTEQFGPCGIGWKYVITRQWLEHGGNDEVSAFVNIDLFIKVEGEWSEAIPGTGGSSFVAKEKNGLYTSDECFKMALTDAISVSCKALGFGADVYWREDPTKYRDSQDAQHNKSNKQDKALILVKQYAIQAGMKTPDLISYIQTTFGEGKKFANLTAKEKENLLVHLKELAGKQAG